MGVWEFNAHGYGHLEVSYGDGGVGFDGTLRGAAIHVDGHQVKWGDVASERGLQRFESR